MRLYKPILFIDSILYRKIQLNNFILIYLYKLKHLCNTLKNKILRYTQNSSFFIGKPLLIIHPIKLFAFIHRYYLKFICHFTNFCNKLAE